MIIQTRIKKITSRVEARIPFTKEGYEKVVAEKKALTAERPDAVENLRKAREMGDLKENGYYQAAKARLVGLDARLRKVDRLVKLGIIMESHGTGRAEIGSKVVLSNGTKEFEYTIVGGFESNPAEKTISYISPIGKALMNKMAGDVVEVSAPKGIIKYKVISVR
jgi:transcription elongation factor GreA